MKCGFFFSVTHTGAWRFPVKNFLICLETTICAGVTGGSLIHACPAVLKRIRLHSDIHVTAHNPAVNAQWHTVCSEVWRKGYAWCMTREEKSMCNTLEITSVSARCNSDAHWIFRSMIWTSTCTSQENHM